jgi:Protein of unknown function (DUF3999)
MSISIKRVFASFVVVPVLSASVLFAGEPPFNNSAVVQLPPLTQEELAELVLPQALYGLTQDNLSDLRIMRSDRVTPVPFLLEHVTKKRCIVSRKTVSLKLLGASELEGEKLQVLLSRGENQDAALFVQEPLKGLTVHTMLRDFERSIKVEVSSDNRTWETVVEAARIFDVTAFADFRETEIKLPNVTQRYLRLTVDNMFSEQMKLTETVKTSGDAKGNLNAIERQFVEAKRPFRIEQVSGWVQRETWVNDDRPLVSREFKLLEDPRDSELQRRFPKASLIFFEAGRAPLERVTLKTASRMFRVECQLLVERKDEEVQPGENRWVRMASASVHRLAFRGFLKEELHVTFSEIRAPKYCLVIPEQTDVSDLVIASCEGPDYRVVFPCNVGDSMVLVCNNPERRGVPGYNADQVRALLNRGITPVKAGLGPVVQDGKGPRQGPKINMSWVLSAAVVLVACVLGVAVVLALKRMPAEEKE